MPEAHPLTITPPSFADRGELAAFQASALRRLIARTWQRIPFYRRMWREAGVDPDSIKGIADLARLPVVRKQDLENDLRAHPPFGSFQGDFPSVRLQASSGSTGKPKPVLHTRTDWENIATLWARRLAAQGVGPTDRVQVAFAFALFIPSFTSAEGAMKLGALVIPTSSGAITPSARQLELARDWGTTVVGTTGGYALHLASVAREQGLDPKRDFNIRAMYHTGEPLVEETRRRIEEAWGCKSYNNYGSVETGAPAWECARQNGLHINEDAYLFEVVDPDTLAPVPDGEEGALVITSLFKEAAPVIRYMIGDIAAIWSEPCGCGCGFRRLSPIRGRIDDMLKIQGAPVYPTAIEATLRQFQQLGPEFRIVVERDNGVDRLEIRAECGHGHGVPDAELADQVKRAIKERVGCTASVALHPFGSLTLPEEVAKRTKNRYVLDLRPKG
ncbi:MAG: AMP-binding protein [Rhodospirillales bacterium]|nr:AMP-binding protein [Rhodospirillales bacterium]